MRTHRWIAALVGALATASITVVGSPATAAPAPGPAATITGTAACDADASDWVITWTITNSADVPLTVRSVSGLPTAPTHVVTGIAIGDVVPVGPATVTATSTLHSYLPDTTVTLGLGFLQPDGTPRVGSPGQLKLPAVCGEPVMPVAEFASTCDGLVVNVAMPAGGYPVSVEVSAQLAAGWVTLAGFQVEPGAPAKATTVIPAQAASVRVGIARVPGYFAAGNWVQPRNCRPPSIGTTQLLASANLNYVTAFYPPTLAAWTIDNDGPGNDFEFYDAGAGDVAIRSVFADQFLTVNAATGLIEANTGRILGDAQKFHLVTNADGTISLRAKINDRYVTAEAAGKEPLVANRTAVGPWEKFSRYAPGTGPEPIIAQVNNAFVTAESAGKKPLIANRGNLGLWERFSIEDLGNGDVAIKSLVNGKYVCAESAGRNPLIANRAAVGPWETFRIVENADYTISFQAKINGRYVTAESADRKPLIANRTAIGPWEKFATT
ncbi:fascin domain-containing protein [Asanoa ferruginea]|uniref:fascin domain-containing protein n=1 Tax=Asanoa ferruginea TaxID=53367 RepID=UPI0011C1BBE6|nr:hypothetical protein [Asanoa ferruginea]